MTESNVINSPPEYLKNQPPSYNQEMVSRSEQFNLQRTTTKQKLGIPDNDPDEDDGCIHRWCVILHCNTILSILCCPCEHGNINTSPMMTANAATGQ